MNSTTELVAVLMVIIVLAIPLTRYYLGQLTGPKKVFEAYVGREWQLVEKTELEKLIGPGGNQVFFYEVGQPMLFDGVAKRSSKNEFLVLCRMAFAGFGAATGGQEGGVGPLNSFIFHYSPQLYPFEGRLQIQSKLSEMSHISHKTKTGNDVLDKAVDVYISEGALDDKNVRSLLSWYTSVLQGGGKKPIVRLANKVLFIGIESPFTSENIDRLLKQSEDAKKALSVQA